MKERSQDHLSSTPSRAVTRSIFLEHLTITGSGLTDRNLTDGHCASLCCFKRKDQQLGTLIQPQRPFNANSEVLGTEPQPTHKDPLMPMEKC